MGIIKKLLLFIGLFIVTSSNSQVAERLEKYSFQVLHDSIKSNYGNPEKARVYVEAYLTKARKENNREKEFNGLYYQALDLAQNREFDEAEKIYNYLLEFTRKHNLEEESIATYDLGGEIQTAVPNFALALERFNKGLDLAEELKNEAYRETELIKISNLLDNTGDVAGAIKIRRKTTAIFERKPIDSTLTQEWKSGTLAYAYYLLSNSYLKIEKVDSARYYNQ